MLPQRISSQPSVGRSIPSDLLRAMPGHWQLRELAGAYVNGNGRCRNVSSEQVRRIMSLRDAVYFGIHCYDSVPSRIIATELRRDVSQDLDDHFEILIDSNHDRRGAYVFEINP